MDRLVARSSWKLNSLVSPWCLEKWRHSTSAPSLGALYERCRFRVLYLELPVHVLSWEDECFSCLLPVVGCFTSSSLQTFLSYTFLHAYLSSYSGLAPLLPCSGPRNFPISFERPINTVGCLFERFCTMWL